MEFRIDHYDVTYPSTNKPQAPLSNSSYIHELNATPICSDEQTTLYLNGIGIPMWIYEAGRLDILHEISLLS